jgi:hypothetical protein
MNDALGADNRINLEPFNSARDIAGGAVGLSPIAGRRIT